MENYEKEFAQQVEFEVKEQEVAMMIINGVAQETSKVKYVEIVCPQCKNTLTSFQPGITLEDVYGVLGVHNDAVRLSAHCPHCGQKIMCDKSFVDTQTPSFGV